MNRRQWILGLALVLMQWSCQEQGPTNVIFILVDDLGWNDLSATGSSLHHTPHLDQLLSESTYFSQAYASCPVCSPTRASLLTGKYPTSLGITDWIPGRNPTDRPLLGTEDKHHLDHNEITLAETMKSQGYTTFFAGKWHLGEEGSWPEDHGFDINLGGHHKGSPPGGYYSPYSNPALTDGPEGEYLPKRLTDESIAFLDDQGDDPFLLYLSFYTVHTPIQASRDHVEAAEARARARGIDTLPAIEEEGGGRTVIHQYNTDYASMVDAMDDNIGRLLAHVESLGLDDNTMVVFTSDNGGLSTLLRSWGAAPTSVRPLRGGKGWCYEGGIRVPLIIKPPAKIRVPTTCDVPVISHDFFPTILDYLGESIPDN
nr:sulfatase [Saprospiraceae bacterium]